MPFCCFEWLSREDRDHLCDLTVLEHHAVEDQFPVGAADEGEVDAALIGVESFQRPRCTAGGNARLR